GADHPDREARRSRDLGQGPARIRDADRRRDQGFDGWQTPEPRSDHRAGDAAQFDRADRRRWPQPAAPRDRSDGAAAAGLRRLLAYREIGVTPRRGAYFFAPRMT